MKPVDIKFEHWIPKTLKMGATTIGHTIYVAYSKQTMNQPAGRLLFKHECIHVQQVENLGGTIPFLFVYFFEWIRAGFSYRNNSMEQSAYRNETLPFTADEEREWSRWFS